MTRDPSQRLEALRERIEESDDISDEDREALEEFERKLALLGSQYSDQTRSETWCSTI